MKRLATILAAMFAAATVQAQEGGGNGSDGKVQEKDAKPQAKFIVISKETMTLTVYGANVNKIAEFPVAIGKNPGNKQKKGDMKTPEGSFEIEQIQDASYWTHDFRDGKGEIKGAYGSHFIRLLTPPHKGIGIHGTHDPSSIGKRVTEGCIRLRNEDLLKLVRMVRVGMPVTITGSEQDRKADEVGTPTAAATAAANK